MNVRLQAWEELPENGHWFAGIISVTADQVATIVFVPRLDRDRWRPWPPRFPDNVDIVTSALEAARQTAVFADVVVTPDARRAGELEHVESGEVRFRLRYSTEAEFARWQRELEKLALERPSVHAIWPHAEIEHLGVAQLLFDELPAILAPRSST